MNENTRPINPEKLLRKFMGVTIITACSLASVTAVVHLMAFAVPYDLGIWDFPIYIIVTDIVVLLVCIYFISFALPLLRED